MDTTTLRAAPSDDPVLAVHAGVFPYRIAWGWQRDLVARRAAGEIPDVLLTLEHEPVFTAGRTADPAHVLWDDDERARRGIELHEVDRGGDVTYHGPGQLVAYPIIQLAGIRNVVDYVRALEEACVRVAADLGVTAAPVDGYPGVWVGDEKLVAIGARVTRGVTMHGLALNITTDLTHFEGIVPCGIPDRGVCSLRSLGVETTVAEVLPRLRDRFAEVFGCTVQIPRPEDLSIEDLGREGPDPEPARSASRA